MKGVTSTPAPASAWQLLVSPRTVWGVSTKPDTPKTAEMHTDANSRILENLNLHMVFLLF